MKILLKLLTLFGVLISYTKCDNSQEKTFSVSTLLGVPYTMVRFADDKILIGNERFEGYIIDLIAVIAEVIGFNYKVNIVEDGRHGAFYNGTWDGVIGEVHSGRASIGAGPITITSYREKAVDFTFPFMIDGITILYKRASDGKILPFTKVEELAALETTKFGCVLGGETLHFFKQSDNPTYKRIYQRMMADPSTLVDSVSEGIERVKNEDYAFFMGSSHAEYAVARDCNLQQVGGLLHSRGFGLAVQEGSPLRAPLTQAILELQENGVLAHLKAKWWLKDQHC